jgi:hypothetical protein
MARQPAISILSALKHGATNSSNPRGGQMAPTPPKAGHVVTSCESIYNPQGVLNTNPGHSDGADGSDGGFPGQLQTDKPLVPEQ